MKFDQPFKTKSGRSVVELWQELQEEWGLYKKYQWFEEDREECLKHAKNIRKLQDDLGLTLAKFPKLNLITDVMESN